ncbi:OadG family protein [Clostridium sp. AWRP]|uniref:OadG family protein n=1 Tax=Clostridium sp. AWRP TaxID=2212991 RepID=UPI000FD7304A|nr:OadG family protein [Clostridium sp. AWRP]AZV57473.1 hypothetical protein DMR38_13090 [Clostridium sp. AWRP]
MTFFNSLKVSLFGITIVFMVLIILNILVRIQSAVIRSINKKNNQRLKVEKDNKLELKQNIKVSGEKLKLINTDERTAAIIMAIVSDESKIPLEELQFKVIKCLD